MIFRRAYLVALLAGVVLPAVTRGQDTATGVDTPSVPAVKIDLNGPMPKDSAVVVKKLANGLTYYIRPNQDSSGRVELRLVVGVGSSNETARQNSAAALVAYSAMSGTIHFHPHVLAAYLQSLTTGTVTADSTVQLGHLATVYRLRVRSDSGEVAKALAVLADWAQNVSFTPAVIDSGRALALRKLLSVGRTPVTDVAFDSVRMIGTAFAGHLVQGSESALRTLSAMQVTQFYQQWYRPDNMAVIVVGDVTPAQVETWITKQFGAFAKPAKALPTRPPVMVPTRQVPAVAIISDPDSSDTHVQLVYRIPNRPPQLASSFAQNIRDNIYAEIMGQRLGELKTRPNAHIARANTTFEGNGLDGSAIVYDLWVEGTGINSAITAAMTEIDRVAQYGFTPAEFALWYQVLKEKYVDPESSAPELSPKLAAQYVNSFSLGSAYTAQSQLQPILAQIVTSLTPEQLQDEARTLNGAQSRLVLISVPKTDVAQMAAARAITPASIMASSSLAARQAASLDPSSLADTTFTVVLLAPAQEKNLTALLKAEVVKATQLGRTPVVEFGATWCVPCRLLDVSLHLPIMADAFRGMYVIHVDIDAWKPSLATAGFGDLQTIPTFYMINRDGRPTGTTQVGVDGDGTGTSSGSLNTGFATKAAPRLKAFFAKGQKEFQATRTSS